MFSPLKGKSIIFIISQVIAAGLLIFTAYAGLKVLEVLSDVGLEFINDQNTAGFEAQSPEIIFWLVLFIVTGVLTALFGLILDLYEKVDALQRNLTPEKIAAEIKRTEKQGIFGSFSRRIPSTNPASRPVGLMLNKHPDKPDFVVTDLVEFRRKQDEKKNDDD